MKWFKAPVTLAMALMLGLSFGNAAHARGLSNVDVNGNPQNGIVFPEPETSTYPTKNGTARGIYRTDEYLLLLLKKGVGKSAIEDGLGLPHFREGFPVFGNVREWDYIINDHCQLKVLFNRDNNVTSWHWRNEAQCAPREKQPQVIVQQQNPAPAMKQLALSGDALFDFDSHSLSSDGVYQLQREVINRLREYEAQGFTYNTIEIVGHTDRFGTPEYNQMLSQNRAAAVAAYLNDNGIPMERMKAYGAGQNEPIVTCHGYSPTPEVKACLRPNRRVTVEFK